MSSDNGVSRQSKKAGATPPAKTPSKRSKDQQIAQILAMIAAGPAKANEVSVANYELAPHETAAVKAYLEPIAVPKFKKVPGINGVLPDHPSPAIGQAVVAQALGITDDTFYAGALRQLVNASAEGSEIDIEGLNFAVSLVRSIEPRSQLETILAIQMASVHLSSMKYMRKMNHTETIDQLDLQERVVNKLMRTFTSQMEALRKHRNGGNQNVIVKHVHIHEGGQAIVGNVNHGGRAGNQGVTQSHGQDHLPLSVGAALHGDFETNQEPVPSPSRAK